MKIKITDIFVDDQDKALKFYTEKLGFVKKQEVRNGNYKWLTVVSPEEKDGVQLHLGPNDNPAAKSFQDAMYNQNIPAANFFVEDIEKEYEQLQTKGVRFTMPPTKVTGSTIARLDDTVGNLIQLTFIKPEVSR